MNDQLPIGIVLPGAQRWHRAGVVMYAFQLGILPILLLSPDETIDDDIPASVMLVQYPAHATENDLQNVAVEINRYCSRWYVLPLDDYISETAARLSQFATAPCYSIASAHQAFHKHLLREQWNRFCTVHAHLPLASVEYCLFHKGNVVKSSEGFANIESAFIVKPDAYSGSVGVLRAEDKASMQHYIRICAGILKGEAINPEMKGIDIDRHVLVEEAIPRKNDLAGCAEFTAHFISFNGEHHLLGIAEKNIHPITYIETGHVFPSLSFPAEMLATLHTCVGGMLTELQTQNTISNWEFIITPDSRLAMVEGQLRPSGDHVMELIENAFGTSPYTMLFEAYTKGRLALNYSAQKTSMIYWPTPSCVLHKISSLHYPKKLPVGVHLQVDEAALLSATNWDGPLSWYDRHVSIICTANNVIDARKTCAEVLRQCRLVGFSNDDSETSANLLF